MIRLLLVALLLLLPVRALAARNILVFGDSLSAGYGLDNGSGWVALLAKKLQSTGSAYEVVNASVSGETTAGGVSRLADALDLHKPEIVLLELGANDGLRGQPPAVMQANLEKMIDQIRARGARPLLFEMRIPNNYGPVYTQKFTQAFHDAAADKKIPLVPFFLGTVATDVDRWFQEDGIHPNASAQPQLMETVWASLAPLIAPGSKTAPASAAGRRP